VFVCPKAHTEGSLTTTGNVFCCSQAHTEGPLTTTDEVFFGSLAHAVDPLTTVGHVLIDLQPGSCESAPIQSAGSDPSNTHLPASKIPVSVTASPALCVPKSEPGPDGDYVSTNAGFCHALLRQQYVIH
jgi:hypothetical protein